MKRKPKKFKRYEKFKAGKDGRVKNILDSVERNQPHINPKVIAREEEKIQLFFKSQGKRKDKKKKK